MRTVALAIGRFARGEYGPRGNAILLVLTVVVGAGWAIAGATGLALFFGLCAVIQALLVWLKLRRPEALRSRHRDDS